MRSEANFTMARFRVPSWSTLWRHYFVPFVLFVVELSGAVQIMSLTGPRVIDQFLTARTLAQ